ncbi:scavenger receptor class B member 1, partial [Notechis scutatus]|uniref:Scavenger receptor class B member 1 n=1 Tax=Notechis scutatus TaxID=8663 RepID=A0A6J1VY19_9SAUR
NWHIWEIPNLKVPSFLAISKHYKSHPPAPIISSPAPITIIPTRNILSPRCRSREYREKKNITFHSNNTVSFLSYRSFTFEPDRSNGLESDYIMMPNMLVLGAAVMLEKMPFAARLTFSSALALFRQSAFMNRTVGEIVWGYKEPFIKFLSNLGVTIGPSNEKFGLFSDLNNSHSGLFTVFTGVDNINKTHMVDSWNGLKEVSYWHSEECNMINGTAGEIWPPFMTPSSPVELYAPDACRSLKLNYTQSGNFKGIPVYRYMAPKTLFANGTIYPPNEGFCPCRQSGIQNISSCKLNAPIFISQPHFLNADPALMDTVVGLHPNEKDHDLFVDIHPLTGIPMNCSVKIQLNLFIKHVSGIWQTGQIKPVVLPVIWFSEVSVGLSACLHIQTHTHTHTNREREREKQREKTPEKDVYGLH